MNATAPALDFTAGVPGGTPRLQVAPLVDIVFLLISFFMLTSELIRTQKDPAVELPVMMSPDAAQEAPAEVTVNLRADGVLTVDGQPTTHEGLRAALAARLDRARQHGEVLRVVLRADRRLSFGRLDEVLTVCRGLRLPQVIFRARPEE